MENKQCKEKVVNTKVSFRTFEQLKVIAKRANVSIYTILQVVVNCFVKVFCEREPMTDEMREILYKFTDFDRVKDGFCLSAPILGNVRMSKCLAIVSKQNKDISEIVLIENENDTLTENRNNDEILAIFLQAFSPAILRGLRSIMQTEKMHNLTDALFFAIRETTPAPGDLIHEEVRELFEDADEFVCGESPMTKPAVDNMPASRWEFGTHKRQYTKSFEAFEREQMKDKNTVQCVGTLQELEENIEVNFEEE